MSSAASEVSASLRTLVAFGRLLGEEGQGDCFRYAYQQVQERGGRLVQAVVVHPWTGVRFPHAWVEFKGKAYDWQTSQGLGKGRLRKVAEFRELWKPTDEKVFDASEAAAHALRTKHFGPW
jgi:hypothetical protein